MIRAVTYHATQGEAEREGIDYCLAWGRAYSPNYSVSYSESVGQWACYVTRWTSCD